MLGKLSKKSVNYRRLSQRLNVTRVATSKYYGYGSGLNINFEEGPLTKEQIKKRN